MRGCNARINTRNVVRNVADYAASVVGIDVASVGSTSGTTVGAVGVEITGWHGTIPGAYTWHGHRVTLWTTKGLTWT